MRGLIVCFLGLATSILVSVSIGPAVAQTSWAAAATAVERQRNTYMEKAHALGAERFLGNVLYGARLSHAQGMAVTQRGNGSTGIAGITVLPERDCNASAQRSSGAT